VYSAASRTVVVFVGEKNPANNLKVAFAGFLVGGYVAVQCGREQAVLGTK